MTGGERSDEALLRAHADGDPDAFAEIFRRHRDRLWAVALRTTGDREEAADALQDALLSAHRAADRFRGDSAVTTWLHRIVVNACLDRLRRRQARPTVPLPDGSRQHEPGGRHTGGVEPAAPAPDHDTALVVRQALGQLPAEQRVALILIDVQGYSVAEAATIMQVAEGTVKSRCARGRARLAILLGHLRPRRESPPAEGGAAEGGAAEGGAAEGGAAGPTGLAGDAASAAAPAGLAGPAGDVGPEPAGRSGEAEVPDGNRTAGGGVRTGARPPVGEKDAARGAPQAGAPASARREEQR